MQERKRGRDSEGEVREELEMVKNTWKKLEQTGIGKKEIEKLLSFWDKLKVEIFAYCFFIVCIFVVLVSLLSVIFHGWQMSMF